MSLRDWFAGQALKQIMPWDFDSPTGASLTKYADNIAKTAWAIADAMLKEREK